MNCDRFSQYIDDLVDGELSQSIKAECEQHIESCPSCKAIYDNYVFMITGLNDLGNFENSDIEFPSNLHESIMSSVLNSVTEVATESNIINISESDLKSENIVNNNETSSDNIIDITKFNQTNTQTNKTKTQPSFYKKYGNSLVAGIVSIFVATGAYQTYQHLSSPAVVQTPMITIDAGGSKNETATNEASNETSRTEETQSTTYEIADGSEEIQANVLSENLDTSNTTPTTGYGSTANGSTAKGITQESITKDNTNVKVGESSSTQGNVNGSTSNTTNKATTPEVSASPTSLQQPQTTRAKSTSTTPEFKISVNSKDLDAYLDYLSSSPDFSINGVTKVGDTIQVTGSSKDFEKFVNFAKDYSDIENPNINVEYSDDTLAKIKETGQFKFTLQQH